VGHLTDDDGDGRIGPGDVPDVVLIHFDFRTRTGEIVALHGDTGQEIFNIDSVPVWTGALALADIDGDCIVEILAAHRSTWTLVAFEHTGALKFVGPTPPSGRYVYLRDTIGVADLDQDGTPEIYTADEIVDSTGVFRCAGGAGRGDGHGAIPISNAADIDPTNPGLELIGGNTIYDSSCNILHNNPAIEDGYTALGDFDGDGDAEILLTTRNYWVHLLADDLTLLGSYGPLPCTQPPPYRCEPAPPSVGDLDGDGMAEAFVTNGELGYALKWNLTAGALVELWPPVPVRDLSRLNTSSVYDVDGDGNDDVLYHDENYWYILDGPTGAPVVVVPFPTATGHEAPVVVDVDADGVTEILVSGCKGHFPYDPSTTNKLVAYECTGAPTARRIWNQYEYHVENVQHDGTVPRFETPIWWSHDLWMGQLTSGPEGPCWPPPSGGNPPTCSAGGDIAQQCDGVQLDGDADDPDGDPLTVLWTSSCPGTTFVPGADVLDPVITLGSSCAQSCTLTLLVDDNKDGTCADDVQVDVDDDTAPVLDRPANATVECNQPTAPSSTGTATATDNCDLAPAVTYTDSVTPGTCAQERTITRTWTATDACSNASSENQTIEVVDTTAPILLVPPSVTVECDQPTTPSSTGTARAGDNCDTAPTVTYSDSVTPGPCPQDYTITRTWTATDACSNVTTGTQTIRVVDTTPPALIIPPDVTVECDQSTAPSSTGTATAADNCDPAPTVSFTDAVTPGRCPQEWTITRTWTAADACSNSSSGVQVIEVVDTTAPTVVPVGNSEACLWPPNHKYVCFEQFSGWFQIVDNCDANPLEDAVGCESNQCEDARCPDFPGQNGDGHTFHDCTHDPDLDRLCMRAERAGTDRGGRIYGVSVVGIDACGNRSPETGVLAVSVAHDRRERPECSAAPPRR
jgi:hypothetical protein